MTVPDFDEITAHQSQAREFLAKSWDYLAAGDLHQASEKGWGAVAHMAKAVAVAQGWRYSNHSHFHVVMNEAALASGNDRLLLLSGRAEILHINYYQRKRHLNATIISKDIESIAELVDLLAPLTRTESGG